jgi:uncharacterized protein HemX
MAANARTLKVCFALSAVGLLSAGVLSAYLESSHQSPTPLDALKAFVFPDEADSDSTTVQAPPVLDFSEANLLMGWAVLSAVGICIAAWQALKVQATTENAQLRAVTVICSSLAGVCLLVLTPFLMSAYRLAYG